MIGHTPNFPRGGIEIDWVQATATGRIDGVYK